MRPHSRFVALFPCAGYARYLLHHWWGRACRYGLRYVDEPWRGHRFVRAPSFRNAATWTTAHTLIQCGGGILTERVAEADYFIGESAKTVSQAALEAEMKVGAFFCGERGELGGDRGGFLRSRAPYSPQLGCSKCGWTSARYVA